MRESVKKVLLSKIYRNAKSDRHFIVDALKAGAIDSPDEGREYIKERKATEEVRDISA